MAKKAFCNTAVRYCSAKSPLRTPPKTGQNEPAWTGVAGPWDHTDTGHACSSETCRAKPVGANPARRNRKRNSQVTKSKPTGDGPITIKKYANRRLYNTATSSYVTLENLADMVKGGEDFKVFDAKSGEDITKSVLTQIIFDEEAKGQNLLPISFLRQLIGFYDDNMKVFVPSFLEMSMESFTKSQDEIRGRLSEAFDPNVTYKNFEEQIRQNMTMFQNTMQSLSPFGDTFGNMPGKRPADEDAAAPGKNNPKEDNSPSDIDDLKSQLASMQAQLDKLAKD